jgi:DNA primase
MDVVSLYQSGVKNVSASLGTALTENQAKMLKRYTGNIVLSYDSDSAGQAAALRGIDILYNEGCKARVLHVTDGKDPDEFVKKKGRQAFLELVDGALSYADYKINVLKNRHNLDETDGRIEFVKETVAALRNLSPAERDIYIKKIAAEAKISEGAIRLEFRGNNNSERAERGKTHGKPHSEKPAGHDITPMEKNLIKLIINDSRTFETILPYSYIFKSAAGDNIFSNIKAMYTDGEEIDINKLADSIDNGSADVFRSIVENVSLGGKDQEILEDCIITMEIEKLRNRYEEINTIIELADETENQEKIRQLMTEQMEIQKQMQHMKERG